MVARIIERSEGKYRIIADWLSRQYCLYLIDHYESHPVHTLVRTTVSTPLSTEDTIHTSICNASLDSFMVHTLILLLSSGSSVTESPEPLNLSPISPQKLSLLDMFNTVHGGRNFHPGIKKTYEAMNTSFPGHKIPIRVIADLISECPTCQKVRLGLDHTIPVEILHLKQPHNRA
jgi:hypothetical protein